MTTFLIVDDSQPYRAMLEDSLRREGFDVVATGTPAEFLLGLEQLDAAAACVLDLSLGNTSPLSETFQLFSRTFPSHTLTIDEFLRSLDTGRSEPTDGRALLLLSRSVRPEIPVAILTNAETTRKDLYDWLKAAGAACIVEKWTEDESPELSAEVPQAVAQVLRDLRGTIQLDRRTVAVPKVVEEPAKDAAAVHTQRPLRTKLTPLSDYINNHSDFTPSLSGILKHFCGAWSAAFNTKAEILLYNRKQQVLEKIAVHGFQDDASATNVRTIGDRFEQEGLCGYAARNNCPILVPEVEFDRRYRPIPGADMTKSELAVPLRLRNTVVGILNLESDVVGAFSHDDQSFFEATGPIIALLMEHETFLAEEAMVRDTIAALTGKNQISQIFEVALRRILAILGPECLGAFFEPVRKGQLQGLRAIANEGLDLSTEHILDPKDHRIFQSAIVGRSKTYYWAAGVDDSGDNPLLEGARSRYVLALEADGNLVAILDVESRRRAISERYRRAVERICDYVAGKISSLESRAKGERQNTLSDARAAIKMEVHSLDSLAAALKDFNLARSPKNTIAEMTQLGNLIHRRLRQTSKLIDTCFQEPSKVDLALALEEAKAFAEQSGIPLILQFDRGLDMNIMAIPASVQWTFENLINNTRKHARNRSDGPVAAVSARSDLDMIIVEFSDNGQSDRRFDNFFNQEHAGRGLHDIRDNASRNGWKVRSATTNDGGLIAIIEFKRFHNKVAEPI